MTTTISSRKFNQDASGAKKAAKQGPVFITDRGKPSHVLITVEDYQRLAGDELSLLDAVRQHEPSDFDFQPPRLNGTIHRSAEFD